MRSFLRSVLILCLFVPYTLRAEKRAFTIEDLYRLKSVSDLQVSPDGKVPALHDHNP